MTGRRVQDPGLSLLELVVAMALFALVAVMGLQSLGGTMRMSERLGEIDTSTAEIGNALALLRSDIGAVVPMLFYPPGAAPRSAIDLRGGPLLALSLAGQPGLSPANGDRHRAEWRLDAADGTLYRRFWPTLIPADAAQASPEMAVLSGVRGLELRTYWAGLGWVAGAAPPVGDIVLSSDAPGDDDSGGAPPPTYFSTLPLALEVTLSTEHHGELRLVQSLR